MAAGSGGWGGDDLEPQVQVLAKGFRSITYFCRLPTDGGSVNVISHPCGMALTVGDECVITHLETVCD